MTKPKKLVLCKGFPGSGKSTLARLIYEKNEWDNSVIHSTDDFHIRLIVEKNLDGSIRHEWKYIFDGSKLGEYHFRNLCEAISSMTNSVSLVIIDNTNVTFKELKKYCVAAITLGYEIELVEPNTEWKYNIEECAKRNTHGVSLEVIQKMRVCTDEHSFRT